MVRAHPHKPSCRARLALLHPVAVWPLESAPASTPTEPPDAVAQAHPSHTRDEDGGPAPMGGAGGMPLYAMAYP